MYAKLMYLFVFCMFFNGCGEADPYAKAPKNCRASTSSKNIAVVCAEPVKIKELINKPKGQVESILGRSYNKDLNLPDLHHITAYRGGGIFIIYDKNLTAHTVVIHPDQLRFNDESILSFLSAESISTKSEVAKLFGMYALAWPKDPEFYYVGAISEADSPYVNNIIVYRSPDDLKNTPIH